MAKLQLRLMGLAAIESRIRECLDAVVELGQLLAEVNQQRLYKQTFSTFEAYCWERWRISRHRAYQLIGAAETAGFLLTGRPQLLPENENQYRMLGKLPLEERALLWQQALEEADGEQPAAAAIARLIAERMAALSDQEQLQAVAGYQQALVERQDEADSREARPKDWPKMLTKFERYMIELEREDPEQAADIDALVPILRRVLERERRKRRG